MFVIVSFERDFCSKLNVRALQSLMRPAYANAFTGPVANSEEEC